MVALFLIVVSILLLNSKFKITAYCMGTTTFTGKPVKVGMCAVDPRVIPLGSKVIIKGIGTFVAEDTGGKVKGRTIDIYIPDCEKAWEFGVKRASVKIRR